MIFFSTHIFFSKLHSFYQLQLVFFSPTLIFLKIDPFFLEIFLHLLTPYFLVFTPQLYLHFHYFDPSRVRLSFLSMNLNIALPSSLAEKSTARAFLNKNYAIVFMLLTWILLDFRNIRSILFYTIFFL